MICGNHSKPQPPHTIWIITNFQDNFFDQIVVESIVSFTAQDLFVRV